MGKIAEFKATEGAKDVDCEIVETSSTVSTKKVKKPLPLRIQPLRESGKRKLEVKEETAPKSSVKRAKRSKSGKEILMEVECSERFLMEEGLVEVFELLKAQGCEKLCESQDLVCPEAVHDFYKELILVDGEIPALEVKFRGRKFRVSSMELALFLSLPHSGYDMFSKGNSWPEEANCCGGRLFRICDKISCYSEINCCGERSFGREECSEGAERRTQGGEGWSPSTAFQSLKFFSLKMVTFD